MRSAKVIPRLITDLLSAIIISKTETYAEQIEDSQMRDVNF